MMNKKILPKLLIASVLVGGVNFLPAVVNFDAENLQIVSVAHAEVKTVTANGSAGMSFGDDNQKLVKIVKEKAKSLAIQAAKEKAGIYIKSYVKNTNHTLTDDDVTAYTSKKINILSDSYKKDYYNESDLKGNLTGNVGFKYIATVTAEIDTSDLQNYARRDEKEKLALAEQEKYLQKNIDEVNKNIEDLSKNTKILEEQKLLEMYVDQIDSNIKANQKIADSNKFYYEKKYKDFVITRSEALNTYTCIGIGTAKHIMSDYESPNVAKEIAKHEAIRTITEKIATYIKDGVKVSDDVANVVALNNLQVIEVKYTMTENDYYGLMEIKAFVKAKIDDEDIVKWRQNALKLFSEE